MKQAGNALFLILIAVALFAALSYAVTQSGRGGGNIDREQTALEAAQLIQYITQVQTAVDKMMLLNGCTDTTLSVLIDSDEDGVRETNGNDAGYNSSSPSDESCDVFAPNGGGVIYSKPSNAIRDVSELTSASYDRTGHILFSRGNAIDGLGTTVSNASATELMLMIPYVTQAFCTEIANNLSLSQANIDEADILMPLTVAAGFSGTYSSPTIIGDDAGSQDFRGEVIQCINETGSSTAGLHFYAAIIVR